MAEPEPDHNQDALWARINRLERRVHFLMGIIIPTGGAVAGSVSFQLLHRLAGWQVSNAFYPAVVIFLVVVYWLYTRLGLIR